MYINRSIENETKHLMQDCTGKTIHELGYPEHMCLLFELGLEEVFQTGQTKTFEFDFVSPAGMMHYVTNLVADTYSKEGTVETVLAISMNTTAQLSAEAKIWEGEEKYRSLFENSLDAILLTIPDGSILAANPAACEMFGRTEAEICEVGRGGLVDMSDPRLNPILYERARSGRVRSELTFIRAGGTKFPGDAFSAVFKDKAGQERTCIIIRDISERKKAEEQQIQLQFQINNILESISDAFVAIDSKWNYTYVNEKALDLLDKKWQDIIGKNVWETFPESVDKPIYKACQRVVSEKCPTTIEQYNAVLDRWFDNRIFPSRDGVTIYFQDITHRKRTEDMLRKNEERIRLAIKSADITVFNQDTNLRFTWIYNPIFGYSPEMITGKSDMDILEPDDARYISQLKQKVIDTGTGSHNEITLSSPIGNLVLEMFLEPLHDEKNHIVGLTGALLDITARKKIENDLHKSHEQLHVLASHLQSVREEERLNLSRKLHDDLGQSMTGLKMDLVWISKKMAEHEGINTDLIVQKIKRISEMIDAMIKSVRVISTELRPNVIDYLGLVAAVECEVEEFTKRSGIDCSFNSNVEKVNLDPAVATAIYRILQEALTNVIRHAGATKVLLSLTVEKDEIQLRIEDDGIGVSQSEISNINAIGILGMKERALLFGGELQITGSPHKGTQILLTLPFKG